jgi:sulfur-oxidizing protein SoxY
MGEYRSAVDRRHLLAAALAWPLLARAAPTYAPGDDPQRIPVWLRVRESLFQDRTIAAAPPGLLSLEVPARAVDAAVVPLAIRSGFPQTAERHVRRLYLFIDANPSPIAAIFEFTPASGRAEVETRVRVDEYSWVRAVAELNDGRLYTVNEFVKASGGCSAPAGTDAATAMVSRGRVSLRVIGDPDGKAPVLAQLVILHPNHSGLAMDQHSRQYTPADFVRRVEVRLGGTPVFTADVDFSIAENPYFRFFLDPAAGRELQVEVLDSQQRRFAHAQPLRPAP